METLLQTYCFEIEVTCTEASAQDAFVKRMALHLAQYLAVFLAEIITGLLQRVLTHLARGLVDDECSAAHTEVLRPGYTQSCLCASSWHRAVRQEKQRQPTGLVKVFVSSTMGPPPRSIAGENLRMLKRCLAVAVGRLFVCMVFSIMDAPCS